jgi:hypothetical protein
MNNEFCKTQACDTCKAQCQSRSISILLPKHIWELMETVHDEGGPSPGAMVRAAVATVIVTLTELALDAKSQPIVASTMN